MYILKNALTSIRRNKGRNILIGIIVIVIACACTVTLSIRNAAITLVDSYENKYNIEATLSFNRKNLMSNFNPGSDNSENNIKTFNSISALTVDEINNYGNSDYVNSYYYTYSLGMNSDTLTAGTDMIDKIQTETSIKTTISGGNAPGGGLNRGQSSSTTTTTTHEEIKNMRGTNGDFTVVGYSSYEGMSDFINGNYKITDGEVSNDFNSNNCVINSELATLNELSVGDTITLVSTNDETLTYELTITGIYEDSSETSNSMTNMYTSSVNTIITNSAIVEQMSKDDEEASTTITPTFILKDKDSIDLFTQEVAQKGLSENYQVVTNLDTIESETESINNVKTFATTFLLITLIIGTIVLFVINMINVRERKYEIGVLRTIGMKKILVISQFVFELLIISIVSLLIGCGIGSCLSVPTANQLLASEIQNSNSASENIESNFGGKNQNAPGTNFKNMNGVAKIQAVTEINAVVDYKVLIQLLGVGIMLTLVSSLASMISISRFSPITILKERS